MSIFQNGEVLWYLGPEDRLRDHLEQLPPECLLSLLGVLHSLNPSCLWLNRDPLRRVLGPTTPAPLRVA